MDARDIAVLRVVDGLWETYRWVPVGELRERLPGRVPLEKKLSGLEKQGMLVWESRSFRGEPAVRLTERGLDMLAAWDYKRHGVIDDIGHVVGEGKESVVVLALKGDEKRVVKFHRYNSAEFRRIKRSLSYSAIEWWKEWTGRDMRPVDVPRAKAQVEFRALEKLHGRVPVPEPFGINRHSIVMEFLGEGVAAPLLSRMGSGVVDKETVMESYEAAVAEGVVHGDFSPYNVMLSDQAYIIDWPQAVPADFPRAGEIMERDRRTMEKFFG